MLLWRTHFLIDILHTTEFDRFVWCLGKVWSCKRLCIWCYHCLILHIHGASYNPATRRYQRQGQGEYFNLNCYSINKFLFYLVALCIANILKTDPKKSVISVFRMTIHYFDLIFFLFSFNKTCYVFSGQSQSFAITTRKTATFTSWPCLQDFEDMLEQPLIFILYWVVPKMKLKYALCMMVYGRYEHCMETEKNYNIIKKYSKVSNS